jgi:hypothetical protein
VGAGFGEVEPEQGTDVGSVLGDGRCPEELIALAAEGSFGAWQTEVRRLVDLFDQDGPPPDDQTRNRLKFGETLDGITHLTGTMTGDVALIVATAVEARADALFRHYTKDHNLDPSIEVPSRATLWMLALAALISEKTTGRAEVSRQHRLRPTRAIRARVRRASLHPSPAHRGASKSRPAD